MHAVSGKLVSGSMTSSSAGKHPTLSRPLKKQWLHELLYKLDHKNAAALLTVDLHGPFAEVTYGESAFVKTVNLLFIHLAIKNNLPA